MKKAILTSLIMIGFCGCASPGRFALIDLDLRTPEQIEAYREEALATYDKDVKSASEVPLKNVSVWSFIQPILDSFKGRIRIFAFEWQGNESKETK